MVRLHNRGNQWTLATFVAVVVKVNIGTFVTMLTRKSNNICDHDSCVAELKIAIIYALVILVTVQQW